MQVIYTKFLQSTDYRGQRIKATSSSGESLTISWDYAWSTAVNHKVAAHKLKVKLGWDFPMVGGDTKNGYVFVNQNETDLLI